MFAHTHRADVTLERYGPIWISPPWAVRVLLRVVLHDDRLLSPLVRFLAQRGEDAECICIARFTRQMRRTLMWAHLQAADISPKIKTPSDLHSRDSWEMFTSTFCTVCFVFNLIAHYAAEKNVVIFASRLWRNHQKYPQASAEPLYPLTCWRKHFILGFLSGGGVGLFIPAVLTNLFFYGGKNVTMLWGLIRRPSEMYSLPHSLSLKVTLEQLKGNPNVRRGTGSPPPWKSGVGWWVFVGFCISYGA